MSAAGVAAPPAESTWLADLQAYEHTRRREINPELLQNPTKRLARSDVAYAERAYDTLNQRFRDPSREATLRGLEDQERSKHLNRARDVQIRRERKEYDIVNHEGRLDPLLKPHERMSAFDQVPPTNEFVQNPTSTAVDYNIVSNLPFDVHHWAAPDKRPPVHQRETRRRFVPPCNIKDFNIVSNRYVKGHEEKALRDQQLTLLECTHKFRQRNRFDPVMQRMTDATTEANLRATEDARAVDEVLRAEARQPLQYHGRETKGYDLVTHEVRDPEFLDILESAEEGRKARYRTKHLVDQAIKAREIEGEDLCAAQKHTQISHERFLECTRRGHDLLTNLPHGDGPKYQKLRQPQTEPKQGVWDKVLSDRAPPVPQGAFPDVGGAGGAGTWAGTQASQTTSGAAAEEILRLNLLSHGGSARSGAGRSGASDIGAGDIGAVRRASGGGGTTTGPEVASASARGSGGGGGGSVAPRSTGDRRARPGDGPVSARGPGPRPRPSPAPSGSYTARGAAQVPSSLAAAPQAAPPAAPPAPAVPGSPRAGSVYSRPRS